MSIYAILHAPDAPLPETNTEVIRELLSGYREALSDRESLTLYAQSMGRIEAENVSLVLAEIGRARAVIRLAEQRFID